ncbi:MAG: hypothetical protein N3C61_02410 [Candidatus Micrarchaeota archaeon]|nr:hypothetical protein [Candidatus Micrarchaeota archaeon]
MIYELLIISLVILVYYDLRYVVPNLPLSLLITSLVLVNTDRYILWIVSLTITFIVYETISVAIRRNFVDRSDYLHIANSISLLQDLTYLPVFLIIYVLMILATTLVYKHRIPTVAQLYISVFIISVALGDSAP